MLAQGRGEFAGAGSLISPPSDHFLLNSEEGACPKTSPHCWGVAGSSGAVEIQTSKKPFKRQEKVPSAVGFQQLPLSVVQKGRTEQWFDASV